MLGASLFMFVDSFSFSYNASLFPQLTSGGVIIGSSLLLLRDYLPDSLNRIVTAEGGVLTTDEQEEAADTDTQTNQETRRNWYFLAFSVTAYVVLGRLISLLWASPIFALMYSVWHKMEWYKVVMLTVVSYLIPKLLMRLVFLPIDEGILLP